MKCCKFAAFGLVAAITVAGSIALAQSQTPPKDADKPTAPKAPPSTAPAKHAPAGQDAPQLPPGWTEADMQACMEAGTPGEMHALLAQSVGVWNGKSSMWMAPGTEPMTSECVSTISPIMDGRFTKCEIKGEMPGMGPFNGFGIYGYDNVSKEFQSTWIDNCGTGMMTGTGDLSSDGKTLTWIYNYHCPITKKPVTLREVERNISKDSKTLEMYGIDPKSGKEFKMMEIAFTRKAGAPTKSATAPGSH